MSLASFLAGILPVHRRRLATGRQVFYGLIAYSWSTRSRSERRTLINALVDHGWTGVHFELIERMAWWPRADIVSDYVSAVKPRVDRLMPWLEDTAAAGLFVYLADNNSNADSNKKLPSAGPLIAVSDYLTAKARGYNNLIRLPVAESDSDLRTDIRTAYVAHVEATWPDERTSCMPGRRPHARWAETHMKDTSRPAPGGGPSTLAVSDTGSILIELCGSVTGTEINHDKALGWMTRMLAGGNSVSLYALGTGIDLPLIKRAETITRNLTP